MAQRKKDRKAKELPAEKAEGELFAEAGQPSLSCDGECDEDSYSEQLIAQEPREIAADEPQAHDEPSEEFFSSLPATSTEHEEKPGVGEWRSGGYVVLARRYRPQTFDDLVGQEHVREALRRAILEGEVAHAYLFSGPRGTGKTSTARILAKAVNCQQNGPRPDPCGQCASCRAIAAGSSLDVIEIDAASNTGVDNIRDLRTGVVLAPFSRYKVYIIDEVHMLSMQAFNALLKTLEEPPPRVIFVMATTELHKVPATIISRCQCFQFRRFTTKQIADHLDRILEKEAAERGIAVDPAEKRRILELIAQAAEGGMRDAQVALDQILVLCRERLDYETVRRFLGGVQSSLIEKFIKGIAEKRTEELILLLDEIVSAGMDLERFVKGVAEYLRNLLLLREVGKNSNLFDLPEDCLDSMEQLANLFSLSRLVNLCSTFIALVDRVKTSSSARFLLELEIVRLTCLDPEDDLSKLVQELKSLEQKWLAPAPSSTEISQKTSAGHAQASASSVVATAPAKSFGQLPQVRQEPSKAQESVLAEPENQKVKSPADVGVSVAPGHQIPRTDGEENPFAKLSDGPLPPPLVGRISEAAGEKNKALGRALSKVTGWWLDKDSLSLKVNPAERFSFDVINRAGNQQILTDLVRLMTGRSVELRIEFTDASGEAEPTATSTEVPGKAMGDRETVREDKHREDPAIEFSDAEPESPDSFSAEELETVEADTEDPKHEHEFTGDFDVEGMLRKYRPPLKGERLTRYLEQDPQLAEIVEQFKKVFGVSNDAVSFKPEMAED